MCFQTIYLDVNAISCLQLASLAGPLCEEPMMGVGFVIEDLTVEETSKPSEVYGPLSGQIMSSVKEGCRRAFQV